MSRTVRFGFQVNLFRKMNRGLAPAHVEFIDRSKIIRLSLSR
jgi:hypothetical protein